MKKLKYDISINIKVNINGYLMNNLIKNSFCINEVHVFLQNRHRSLLVIEDT